MERIKRHDLTRGGVALGLGFGLSNVHTGFIAVWLCLVLVSEDVSSRLFFHSAIMDCKPFGTVSKMKCFLL